MMHSKYDPTTEEKFRQTPYRETSTRCEDCGNQVNRTDLLAEVKLYDMLAVAEKTLREVYPDCEHLRLTIETRSGRYAVR